MMVRASPELNFFLNGNPHKAVAGQTLAAALAQCGEHSLSRDVSGQPRGLFCGMGTCHDCLVTVDGRLSQRACMTPVREGMRVERAAPRPHIDAPRLRELAPVPPALVCHEADVLIVGAGPGGLAAAEACARAGASTLLVDERSSPGGQFYKQPVTQPARQLLAGDRQARQGAERIATVEQLGVRVFRSTLIWGGARDEDGRLRIACLGDGGDAFYCRPKALIIATGAYERARTVPGWTLPGVMTAGSAQTLLRSYAAVPGRRIAIAGNGPLNLQVAHEIGRAGGEVSVLAEEAPAPWERVAAAARLLGAAPVLSSRGAGQIARLVSRGVPLLWRARVIAIEGDGRVERVRIASPAGERVFEVDTVLLGGNFSPANELSRLLGCHHELSGGKLRVQCSEAGATSQPDIHVVGEAVRFAGAAVARLEGRAAGEAVAVKLGFAPVRSGRRGARDEAPLLRRAHAVQKALWQLYDPDPAARAPAAADLPDDAVVCRCEGVSMAMLRRLAQQGISDLASFKRLTRAGMGRCQGRYCSDILAGLAQQPARRLGETDMAAAPQMPLRPVPLAALAVEKPEWGGHRRVLLPDQTPPYSDEPLGFGEVETLVIGAGIAGAATALFLAREGREVAVIERAYPNALASGGNAGSLHAQLLSFDHGARAEKGGGPAMRTLPLQRDSISLWKSLQDELGSSFDMKVTGGVMVAETEAHMRFLEQKTAAERAAGIECHVVDRATLRDLEPALSQDFLGAAFCPQEGMINPLVATERVLAAARAAGARLATQAQVMAIEAVRAGFRVTTSRGSVMARHVVNASGAFSSRIGAMLGLDVPVFGAPLQMIVTEAAAPLVSRLVAHADRHLTLKQATNGNFIIGGGWTAGLDPVHQHPRPLFSSLEGNLWVAQHVVPALRRIHVIRSWAAMNINIDGAPILGEHPACPGFFTVVTANGYTLGPLVGRLTAMLIVGRDPGYDLAPFSITRFAK